MSNEKLNNKKMNIRLAKTLYKIALQQRDVKMAGELYDDAKKAGFNIDKSIKNR
ncbi:hypothetical protein KAR91_76775 [Candidatus Pacearchaeota archaeon]|nr:hypothetical protein [Candidatus Pacearchaeota archaeon]